MASRTTYKNNTSAAVYAVRERGGARAGKCGPATMCWKHIHVLVSGEEVVGVCKWPQVQVLLLPFAEATLSAAGYTDARERLGYTDALGSIPDSRAQSAQAR